MTDSDPQGGNADEPLLSSGASAVAAIVIAVLVLMGNNLMVQGTQSLFGLLFTGAYDDATFVVTWLFGALLPALASLALGHKAAHDPSATSWERTTGRAAIVLALVALAYTAVLILGGLIHDPFSG